MPKPSEGLRYRGKDPIIKTQFQLSIERTKKDKEKLKKQKPFHGIPESIKSITEHPYYNAPAKDKRVFNAYEIKEEEGKEASDSYLNSILSSKLIERAYGNFIACLNEFKKVPDSLTKFYRGLAKEEKEFVNFIANQLKMHHLTKMALSTLNIHPLALTLSILASRMGFAVATNSSTGLTGVASSSGMAGNFTHFNGTTGSSTGVFQPLQYYFHEGFPINGTSLCRGSSANVCHEFYVNLSPKLGTESVAEGAYYLSSEWEDISSVSTATAPCGNESQLKMLFNWLLTQTENAIGKATCSTSSYSDGRSIHLDYKLTGVSSEVCSALQNQVNKIVTPCVQNTVHFTFDDLCPDYPQSSSANATPFIFLSFLPLYVLLGIFAGRACQQRNARHQRAVHAHAVAPAAAVVGEPAAAEAAPVVAMQPVQESAITPVEGAPSDRAPEHSVTIHVRHTSAASVELSEIQEGRSRPAP